LEIEADSAFIVNSNFDTVDMRLMTGLSHFSHSKLARSFVFFVEFGENRSAEYSIEDSVLVDSAAVSVRQPIVLKNIATNGLFLTDLTDEARLLTFRVVDSIIFPDFTAQADLAALGCQSVEAGEGEGAKIVVCNTGVSLRPVVNHWPEIPDKNCTKDGVMKERFERLGQELDAGGLRLRAISNALSRSNNKP